MRFSVHALLAGLDIDVQLLVNGDIKLLSRNTLHTMELVELGPGPHKDPRPLLLSASPCSDNKSGPTKFRTSVILNL